MTESLSLAVAFFAGLISFLSPCVLPLIPGYISFIGGATFQELQEDRTARRRVLFRTVFFVLGFSSVFVILGILFSGPALLFTSALQWINLAAGFIVVLLGLNVLFDVVSLLQREKRYHVTRRPGSAGGAFVAGMAFGAGWSPCIGPILASILFLAGTSGEMGRAAILLLVYSLGLGVPFLAVGGAFHKVTGYLHRVRRWMGAIRVTSGVFLIMVGLLIAFGRFQQLNGIIISAGMRLESWTAASPELARRVFSAALAAPAAAVVVVVFVRNRGKISRGDSPSGGASRTWIAGSNLPVALTVVFFLALALLQWTGVMNIGSLLSRWLMFQGI